MPVLFNRFAELGARTGVGHCAAELFRGLMQLAPGEIEPFPHGLTWGLGKLWGTVRPALSRAERQHSPGPAGFRTRVLHSIRSFGQDFLAKRFQSMAARGGHTLYHEPNFLPFPCDLPTLSTVHDLSVILHPEWHPAGRVRYYEKRLPGLLRQAVHFISVSRFTSREVTRHLGVSPHLISTIYNGNRAGLGPRPLSDVVPTLRSYGLAPGFLLHVGTIEPRKNLKMLMRAYCGLDQAQREGCPLVLVGNWGWNSEETRGYFHAEARHRGVRHIGYVGDDHLPAFYNGARALVFPTFYEGFGLPPLEMAACGGAVIASTAEAVVEIVGGCAHVVDSQDERGWKNALARIVIDDDWCAELRRRTAGVAEGFTWQSSAAETLAIYRQVTAVPAVSLAA